MSEWESKFIVRCGPLLALAMLLAGCLQAAPPKAPAVEPWALPFACGAGTYSPRQGVCARTLGGEGDTWAEPYVAAHPTDAAAFAIVVQGQAAPVEGGPLGTVTRLLPGGETDAANCLERALCLYLTHDAGTTWTRRTVGGAGQPVMAIDPVVAFQGDDLFVAGLVRNGGGLAVARSSDDGATWSTVVVTDRDKTDRPWLGLRGDQALLVWQTSGQPEGFWSRSIDGGRTWSAPGTLPCNLLSRPVWREDGWRVACSHVDRVLVLRIDAGGRVHTLTELPSASGTLHVAERPDGGLWLTAPGSKPRVRLSEDGGGTWSTPVDLSAPIAGGPWNRSWVPWTEATPDGGLLAYVVVTAGGCVLRCDSDPPMHLVHLGPDGVLAAVQVTPGQGRATTSADERAGGEFNGLACGRVCMAAWMDQGLVDVATPNA